MKSMSTAIRFEFIGLRNVQVGYFLMKDSRHLVP